MKQNIYDDPEFFAGYQALRDGRRGLNEVLEQPAIHSLFPDLRGKQVLDLGCGAGHLCRHLVGLGARRVVGVDISRKMLDAAQAADPGDGSIVYARGAMEDLDLGSGGYDMVVSSLALHYVAEIGPVFRKVAQALKPGGKFVFSTEHPLCTCVLDQGSAWEQDAAGNKLHWRLDAYQQEGPRVSRWFVDGVVRYHRTLSTILNQLVESGLMVERVLEPHAAAEHEAERPDLREERRRPPFLLVRAGRPI